MQTIGQRDGYQRVYPDRASAEAVFNRFENEGIYPDYGKAPWVVFLGRKVGVITKMYVISLFVTTVHILTTLKYRTRVVCQRILWRFIPLMLRSI